MVRRPDVTGDVKASSPNVRHVSYVYNEGHRYSCTWDEPSVAKIWLGDVTAQRVTSLKTEKNPGSVNLCKPFAFCVTCVCKRNPSWITTKRNRLRVQLFLTLLCTKTRHICRR